jgi:hypothetical protein
LWRIIDRDGNGKMVVHRQGQGHAFDRVHPGLGITDYFNHRKYIRPPFVLKHYANCEWADDMSIMFPSPKDVRDALALAELHHKRRDMSTWVPAGYVAPIVIAPEPEKVYASDWAMLDDLCA